MPEALPCGSGLPGPGAGEPGPGGQGELAAFAELAAHGGQSPCSMDDALGALCIAEACELSRARHEPVSITEVRR